MKQFFRIARKGLITAALPAYLLAAYPAMAAPAPDKARFSQVSSWAISRVAPKSSPAYCTIAAKYDNNAVVTIAQNARDETTLAFDFQRPVFLKDQSYFLTLRVGNLTKSFNLKPASSNALIVRTGRDTSISDALPEAGFIELNTNGGVYRFDIDNYSDAQKQMDLCLDTGDSTPPPVAQGVRPLKTKNISEVNAVPPGGGGKTSKVLVSPNADPAEVEAQLRAAIAERDAYRDLLEEAKRKKADAPRPQDQAELGDALKQLDALQAERADLIRKLERAKSESQDVASESESARQLQKTRKTLDLMQGENDSLRKQIEQTQKDALAFRTGAKGSGEAADTVAKLRQQVEELEQQNARLRDTSRSDAQPDPVQQKVDKAFGKDQQPAQKAPEKQTTSRKTDARFQAAEAENRRLAKELNRARQDLLAASTAAASKRDSAIADEVAKAQQPKAPDDAEIERLQNRFEMAERENQRLSKELSRMRAAGDIKSQAGAPKSPTEDLFKSMSSDSADKGVKVASISKAGDDVGAAAGTREWPDGNVIRSLLTKSGIVLAQGFERVRSASGDSFAAFRWDTGSAFGNAEVRPVQGRTFQQGIDAYVAKTKSRCKGSFDQTVNKVKDDLAYGDIACVLKDGKGAGASIVFLQQDGQFDVIAHESDLENLSAAMDARDKVLKAVKDSM